MIQQALAKAVNRVDLSRQEAAETLHHIMSGEVPPVLTAALLTALHMKGESVEEIVGLASTMRAMATPIPAQRRPLIDTCGTGGSGTGHFNVSTVCAFVVAGAGGAVAKHGNRSATSKSGSADVLEALGVNIEAAPAVVARCIDEIGVGFLFARSLHTAMKHVGSIRAELKIRTVFNVLGPLTNPAGATRQVLGVFAPQWADPLAQVLASLGSEHAMVVCGADILDEISLTGSTHVAEVITGTVKCREIVPEDFGLARCSMEALLGGDPQANAAIARAILSGETGPKRDLVVLNSAAALVAGGLAQDIPEGMAQAAESIDSCAAQKKLEALIRMSHDS
ncbi:MAG: anthranilate phosphoribosyltransferase [Candidatus Hydrogenedentes bacterium]|nr:anthranilate phosphoribosyltransferase [Candidatus Hydrogenedentota bacterium]